MYSLCCLSDIRPPPSEHWARHSGCSVLEHCLQGGEQGEGAGRGGDGEELRWCHVLLCRGYYLCLYQSLENLYSSCMYMYIHDVQYTMHVHVHVRCMFMYIEIQTSLDSCPDSSHPYHRGPVPDHHSERGS